MTNPQTEARAIAERLMLPDEDVFDLAVNIIATALAAKDAELAEVKAYSIEMLHRKDEQFERAERAEAQLAEAIDLLGSSLCEMAPISAANHKRRVIEFIAARRALEAQGGER